MLHEYFCSCPPIPQNPKLSFNQRINIHSKTNAFMNIPLLERYYFYYIKAICYTQDFLIWRSGTIWFFASAMGWEIHFRLSIIHEVQTIQWWNVSKRAGLKEEAEEEEETRNEEDGKTSGQLQPMVMNLNSYPYTLYSDSSQRKRQDQAPFMQFVHLFTYRHSFTVRSISHLVVWPSCLAV